MGRHCRLLWAVVAFTVVGAGTLSGCSSTTSASPKALSDRGGSASMSAGPATSESVASAPVGTEPTDYATGPSGRPGGSSARVKAPCDGGTVTVSAYPDHAGVGMTATLRHTTHVRWRLSAHVAPGVAEDDLPTMTNGTVRHGTLGIHADNLSGPGTVKGAGTPSRRWPRTAGLELYAGSGRNEVDCGTAVYLDAQQADFSSQDLTVHLLRSGTLSLMDSPLAGGGARHVAVTVKSPSGTQDMARSVAAKNTHEPPDPYEVQTTLSGLSHLNDFTSVTVTVSKGGQPQAWLTLSRTP